MEWRAAMPTISRQLRIPPVSEASGSKTLDRVAPGQLGVHAGRVDPLPHRHPDRRVVLQPLQTLDLVLGHRLLEEVDAVGGDAAAQLDCGVGVVEPVRVDAHELAGADVLPHGGDGLFVAVDGPAEPHLHAFEAEVHALVEIVGVPLGALFEHRRAGAVQRDRVGAAAQQLVHGRVQGLTEDVPQGDLHRADGLAAEALPSEIAVERNLKVGDAVADGQRIASLQVPRAHVVHHGPKDRRIRVAPVGGRLAPAHGAVVGLNPHQREAALHVGVDLAVAGEHRPHALDSHACSSVMVGRSLMLAAPFPAAPATDRRARGPAGRPGSRPPPRARPSRPQPRPPPGW